jgi:hypothetical protein
MLPEICLRRDMLRKIDSKIAAFKLSQFYLREELSF